MDNKEHIQYWLNSAEHDLDSADALFSAGKYDWCLFLGHLVVGKALKAKCVSVNDEFPPKSHNLLFLCEKAKIELTDGQKEFLDIVNGFNIDTRYPDYKLTFYKNCSKEFTLKHFTKIKEIYRWIRSLII
ncbi:MAG TPA: HEPN domain-containing protein [Spirochaetota bacterium]|nr:HEPN domain-containing protein [Spirochaetota bacterium]